MTTPAISAADVTKRYGDLTAVDGDAFAPPLGGV